MSVSLQKAIARHLILQIKMKTKFNLYLIALLFAIQPVFGQDDIAKRNAAIETFKTSLINTAIADFKFISVDKKVWESKKLKGKVVVINFWFTTCGPCIKEMPLLNDLVAANKEKPVVFIAPGPDEEAKITKFLKKNPFNYHIVPNSLGYITTMKIENFPTHLVVDKEGIIRQVFIGYEDDIREKLQEAIDNQL